MQSPLASALKEAIFEIKEAQCRPMTVALQVGLDMNLEVQIDDRA